MPDIICQNCGSINEYHTVMKSNQNTAWCNVCDRFIKNISQGKPAILHFGKYKGRYVGTMISKDEISYVKWVIEQPWCKSLLKSQLENHIEHFETYPGDWDNWNGLPPNMQEDDGSVNENYTDDFIDPTEPRYE